MLLTILRCRSRLPPPSWCRSSIHPLGVTKTRPFSQYTPRAFPRTSSLRQEHDMNPAKSSSHASEGDSAQAEPRFGASFYEKVGKPGIAKQVFFATVASTFALLLASIQTSIETDDWIERMVAVAPIWSVKAISNTDLKRAQNAELIQRLREKLAGIQTTVQQLPVLIRPWINLIVVGVMQPYADASEGKRLCWKICLLNVGVWALWKVRGLRGFMNVRFMHNPLSGLSYTLLTSAFSHRTALHLFCNCLALESFGSAAYYYLLREQNKAEPELLESTSSYHFLAFFTSAAVFSGLVSHVVNAKFRYPRLVAELASTASATRKTETWASAVAATNAAAASAAKSTAARKTLDILPSLGASGAIYAAVTMTALAFPDSQVALFIPPSYPINIQYGVGGLMLLDVIGIARGWRLFDHWAHLGGAAFGVLYYNYGPTVWRYLRQMNLEAKLEEQTKLEEQKARKQS